MNPKILAKVPQTLAIAFVIMCVVAMALSLRAQQRDNARYGQLKKLPAVTKLQRAETQFTRRLNITADGDCVVFVKRDMLASQAPVLFGKQVIGDKNFLNQLKNLGFNRVRYTNEMESWEFALP